MKQLEKTAIKDLIRFYKLYLESDKKDLRPISRRIYLEYLPARTLLSDITNRAVEMLSAISYDSPHIKKPKKEDVITIVKLLEKELKKSHD